MCWKSYLHKGWLGIALLIFSAHAPAQQPMSPDALQKILDRLDTLEKQNEALIAEVQALRQTVKNAQAASNTQTERLQEQADVQGQQIKDQAQTKVASSQRFSLSLTGMFLFDSYLFTGQTGPAFVAGSDFYGMGGSRAGATLRQSIIGFDFGGPQLPGGGQMHGSLSMDFYAQAANTQTGFDDIFRIRRGVVSFDWKNRSVIVGQDKSLIAPLQPTSFAWVGIPPLSGAGNLWLWRPQIRYEERIALSSSTQATLQAGVLETDEYYTAPYLPSSAYVQPARPALQARFQLQHNWSDETRIVIGLGAHASETHLLGQSVPSRLVSLDAFYKSLRKLEISGTLFYGENFANLGGEPPGVTVENDRTVIPIHGAGGWVQVALPVTSRLTFDVYTGRQANDTNDLNQYEIFRTLTYAGNILYRLSPNVIIGFEGSRNRLDDYEARELLTNRYDATVAYLF
ncbi:MAG TPA: hypothetical protein VHU83_22705 [Bryobacteraceae bacterium]|nr:hypothetical protein [Bryobacteraceae bacterium]